MQEAAALQGVSAVALVFVPGRGWLCTDQVHLGPARSDPGALHVEMLVDGDWFRSEVSGAVAQLHAARFIEGQAVALSRRPESKGAVEAPDESRGRFS